MQWSIIIPTYNRPKILERTLEALINQQNVHDLSYEIIIIDDGSTENNESIIHKMRQKTNTSIDYVQQKNQGQGVARNAGIQKSRGKYTLFLGDDIIASPLLLAEHQKTHTEHPEENAACLGYITWYPDIKITTFMRWLEGELTFFGQCKGHQFAFPDLKDKKIANFNYFYTSNISLKTSLIKGYSFDAAFSSYGWEDIDLGYRLEKEKKLALYYNPRAAGYHYHTLNLESFTKRMKMVGYSAKLFNKKHPELKKIPSSWKKFIFSIISSNLFLSIAKRLSNPALYYYSFSKKYFLEGLKQK